MPIKSATVILLSLFAFGTLYQSNLYAQNQPRDSSSSKAIIVEGVGKTADEAIKDAFRNAIRQAVGAIVDAETIVENDQIIEDKILTYSDAIIRRYEEVQGSKRIQDGLHRIRIKAFVEKSTLEKRLRDAKVVMQEVDGEGLFAEVVTGFEKDHDAAALLSRAFDKFPVGVLTGKTIGKPEVIEKNDTEATVDLTVEVGVDTEAYKKFYTRLSKTLDSICKKPTKYSIEYELNPLTNLQRLHVDKFREYPDFVRGLTKTGDERIKLRPFLVASTAGKNFDCYVMNESLSNVLEEVAKREFIVKLTLLDENGKAVADDSFDRHEIKVTGSSDSVFVPNLMSSEGLSSVITSSLGPVYFVAPFFVERSCTLPQFSANIVSRRTFKLKLSDLQAIKRTKVEIILRERN